MSDYPRVFITGGTRGLGHALAREFATVGCSVFNILADKPERVAAFLVPRMLAARKSGARIAWLTGAKVMWCFATAPLARRRVIP